MSSNKLGYTVKLDNMIEFPMAYQLYMTVKCNPMNI